MDNQNIKEVETNNWNVSPYIKVGIIVGLAGFFFSSIMGQDFCFGLLLIPVIVGGIAGTLTRRYERTGTREEASRLGAWAGGVAGIFIFLGRTFGGIIPLFIVRMFSRLGFLPDRSMEAFESMFSLSFSLNFFNLAIILIITSVAGSIAATRSFD